MLDVWLRLMFGLPPVPIKAIALISVTLTSELR
jgi:hypothetical protein